MCPFESGQGHQQQYIDGLAIARRARHIGDHVHC